MSKKKRSRMEQPQGQPYIHTLQASTHAFESTLARIAGEQEPPKSGTEVEQPVPDLITPVTGYRCWRFDMMTGRLTGQNHARPWAPGENVAGCNDGPQDPTAWMSTLTFSMYSTGASAYQGRSKPKEHTAPGRHCYCGFYATGQWVEVPAAPREDLADATIAGIVEGYGRVLVHSSGWRAEKARIVGLIDPCAALPWLVPTEPYHRILDHLSVTYDVPILDHLPEVNAEVPA